MSTEIPSQDQTKVEQTQETETQPNLGGMGGEGNEISDISDLLGLAAEGEAAPKDEAKEKTGEETPPAKTQAKPDDGKGEQKPAPAPVPGEEVKAGEEAKPAEQSLKDVLKEVLAETRQEAPKVEEKIEEKKPEAPHYNPVVPVEIMQGMESEDPEVRRHAVSAMIGGAMNKVRSDILAQLRGEFAQALSQVPQMITTQQTQAQEAAKFRQSFYEDNPNFATSEKRQQLVAYLAMDLAKRQIAAKTYKGTTPEFRAMLAKEVEDLTGIKAGKAPSQPETKKKDDPPPRKFQAGGSNTRTGEVTQSLSQEISDVIGLPN